MPPPAAVVLFFVTVVRSRTIVPLPPLKRPAPSWCAKLPAIVESVILIVPSTSNCASFAIAGESGS